MPGMATKPQKPKTAAKTGVAKALGGLHISLNAPVTLGFVGLCFIATLLGSLTAGGANSLVFSTYFTSFLDPLFYLRLFTHVLGHSGWGHFARNAVYLLLLGPLLEEKYGGRCLCEVIALTAVVTAVVHAIFMPHSGLLGASGVVFAFIVLGSITNIREGEVPLTFVLVFIIFVGQQLFLGVTVQDNVSNLTHIIGGLVGAFAGFALNRR